MKHVEILAPAGSYDSMIAAYNGGADAVYIGGKQFGARAYAENPDQEMLLKAIDYSHLHHKNLYLTVNTLVKDSELDALVEMMIPLYENGLDGVIIQDMGVLDLFRQIFPGMELHASTQMSVVNSDSANFLKQCGVSRVVPARELSLEEVKSIKKNSGLEVETFVHGALCYSYSGQCMFSSMLGGRSGNRGRCAQPCRLPYQFYQDGKRMNPDNEQYLLSLKDIFTLDRIPELIEAGIDSFKIEGRMKKPEYAAFTSAMYKKYSERYYELGKEGFTIDSPDIERLQSLYHRGESSGGYYSISCGRSMVTLTKPNYETDEGLIDEIRKTYMCGEIKEKIHGALIVLKDFPVKMEASYNGIRAVSEGEVVTEARNQPLTTSALDKRMNKTGNTPFRFSSLDIECGSNTYVSIQGLNELRRNVLESLKSQYLQKYCRKFEGVKENPREFVKELSEPEISVLIEEMDVLDTVLGYPQIRRVYADINVMDHRVKSLSEKIHGAGKEIYAAMPYIYRSRTKDRLSAFLDKNGKCLDGFLLRNIESYVHLRELGFEKKVIFDYNVYTYNQWSRNFWKKQGLLGLTSPVELNYRELQSLGVCEEMIVYGHLPLMVSAQCLTKTCGGCTGTPGQGSLKDRYNKEFHVKNNCTDCYNVVYNGDPLCLFGHIKDLRKLNPTSIRLNFTVETKAEARRILDMLFDALSDGSFRMPDGFRFTKGHFKRGIE